MGLTAQHAKYECDACNICMYAIFHFAKTEVKSVEIFREQMCNCAYLERERERENVSNLQIIFHRAKWVKILSSAWFNLVCDRIFKVGIYLSFRSFCYCFCCCFDWWGCFWYSLWIRRIHLCIDYTGTSAEREKKNPKTGIHYIE